MSADPYDFEAIADRRSAQVITVESSKLVPVLVLLAVLSGVAIAFSWFARDRAFDAETQALLLRAHVDELRIKMAEAGIEVPPLPSNLKTPR